MNVVLGKQQTISVGIRVVLAADVSQIAVAWRCGLPVRRV